MRAAVTATITAPVASGYSSSLVQACDVGRADGELLDGAVKSLSRAQVGPHIQGL